MARTASSHYVLLPAIPTEQMISAIRTAASPQEAYVALLTASGAPPLTEASVISAVRSAEALCPEEEDGAGRFKWIARAIAKSLGITPSTEALEPIHPDWQACATLDALADGLTSNFTADSPAAFRSDALHCLRRAQQFVGDRIAALRAELRQLADAPSSDNSTEEYRNGYFDSLAWVRRVVDRHTEGLEASNR